MKSRARMIRAQVLASPQTVCLALDEMSKAPETPPPVGSARDVLREMWTSRRSEAEADLMFLLSTLEILEDSPSNVDVRPLAQSRAHQLVGVFGVFGFTELKNAMARVDIELSDTTVPLTDLIARTRDILAQLP